MCFRLLHVENGERVFFQSFTQKGLSQLKTLISANLVHCLLFFDVNDLIHYMKFNVYIYAPQQRVYQVFRLCAKLPCVWYHTYCRHTDTRAGASSCQTPLKNVIHGIPRDT